MTTNRRRMTSTELAAYLTECKAKSDRALAQARTDKGVPTRTMTAQERAENRRIARATRRR